MANKLTREQAEAKILDLFKQIHKVHKQYNPNANEMWAITIDGHVSIWNNYTSTDTEYPININSRL